MVIKQILLSIMSSLKMHSSDYCDVETIAGTETIVFKDSTMLSIIRYNGLLSQVSGDSFGRMVDQIANNLNGLMQNSGYKIVCTFRKDLDAFSSLANIEATKKLSVKKLHLDWNDIIEESVDLARAKVYDEEVYFGLMTNLNALDVVEAESLKGNNKKTRSLDTPRASSAQNIFNTSSLLHSRHNEFVERFMGAFRGNDYYVSMEKVSVVKALGIIRHQAQPNSSPRNWTPCVALSQPEMRKQTLKDTYQSPVLMPSNNDLTDLSYILPPDLSRQLLSTHIEILGAAENLPPNTIKCDGRLYASVYMDIPPTTPSIFNDLFSAFNNTAFYDTRNRVRTMPWSITYVITGDGMAGSVLKQVFKDIVGSIPPSTNASMRNAYNQLAWIKKNNKAVVGLQISVMTWIDDDNPKARETLTKRRNRLKHSVESWGGMKVIENVGDPVLGWCSNLVGITNHHVGTKGAAPLPQALMMLPITRPASAFSNGTVINRTLDGKLMLLEKFSSKMRTWIKCIVGSPGSGKSVMLNNDLLETCMLSGLERLPLITVIDKGESSSGFIDLVRDRLPDHLKHQAVVERLRKDKTHAINFLDIRVGLTRPLNDEKLQMEAFLTSLLTPDERDEPYEGTRAFASLLIENLFDSIQEGIENATPNRYLYGSNTELDKYVVENNIVEFEVSPLGEITYHRAVPVSYFALVRKLHKLGEGLKPDSEARARAWRARDLAHRLAMPTMNGISAILAQPKIVASNSNIVGSGETMPKYAERAIADAITRYPCFSHHTQFDVDTARVVALDLQEVVSRQNRKQSSLFVQIARMVGVRKFNLTDDDVKSNIIPKHFKEYYRRELQNLKGDKKVLAIDEYHNYEEDEVFNKLIDTDTREGRKWGLEIILASQKIKDFYFISRTSNGQRVNLLDAVTHLCVCNTPEGDDLKIFRDFFDPINENTGKYKINNSTLSAIELDKEGLTYLSCLTTSKEKYTQLLTLQVAPKLLWSLTTTAEDRLIRRYMYSYTHGDRTKAIAALAHYLPDGAKKQIEMMRSNIVSESTTKLSEDEITDESNKLIQKLAQQALIVYNAKNAQDRELIEEF